jgi:hypothetical protein
VPAAADADAPAAPAAAEEIKANDGEAKMAEPVKTTDSAATDEAAPMDVEATGDEKATGEENKADVDNAKTTEVSFRVCAEGLLLCGVCICSPADEANLKLTAPHTRYTCHSVCTPPLPF